MADNERIALVTGSNRGIGLEIVRQLAGHGVTTILTARTAAKAEHAASSVHGTPGKVLGRALDVTEPESVEDLAQFIDRTFGRLDILVNNAGIFLDADRKARAADIDLDVVRGTLETNLFGAWRMSQVLLPLLVRSGHGRIVNLSSQLGQLAGMTNEYPAYRVSKAALNAFTCVLAAELRESHILVNACSPGWVRTDMGGPDASRSVEEGADTPVWLALLPDDGPTGGFFQDRQPIAW